MLDYILIAPISNIDCNVIDVLSLFISLDRRVSCVKDELLVMRLELDVATSIPFSYVICVVLACVLFKHVFLYTLRETYSISALWKNKML